MIDLKKFRDKKRLLQKEIADKIGVYQSRISKYESGVERTLYLTDKILEEYPEAIEFEYTEQDKIEISHNTQSASQDPEHIYYELETQKKILISNTTSSNINYRLSFQICVL